MSPLTHTIPTELLDRMVSNEVECMWRGDGMKTRNETPRCGKPARWLWIFKTNCKHAVTDCPLCASHHVYLSQRYTDDRAWACRRCLAEAYVIEKRKI